MLLKCEIQFNPEIIFSRRFKIQVIFFINFFLVTFVKIRCLTAYTWRQKQKFKKQLKNENGIN
ncbi:hypothetical protein EFY79_07720 [Hanamia caeni]|uniref:Uncharacterized protein n=1 Tax=Hanamia caeni TaxID=2294116 RepID=A0A3M9NHJ6_9BACT|nr:hypothetical protein EFY79_07720 [Hanamia caeni]